MSDDVEAQLAAMEEAAPLTETPQEQRQQEVQAPVEGETQSAAEGEQQQAQEEQRQPLPPEELQRRYGDLRTALRSERQERRDEKRQFTEQIQRMEHAFQQFQQRINPQQPQTQQPQTDGEILDMLLRERDEQIQWDNYTRQQRAAQEKQARETEERFNAVRADMVDYEDAFRETAPDYDDAAQHLNSVWDKTFELFGYDPQTRAQLLENLAFQVVDAAIKQRRDPAKAIYEAAKGMGYGKATATQVAAAAATGAQPQQQGGQNGASQLAALKAGQEAAKSLSGGGAAVQGEGLTLASIAKLEGAAFDSAMEKLLRNAR